MFLNDNGFESAQHIFDFAKHLFGKIKYNGKQLYFSNGVHISYPNNPINSFADIVISYAKENDGFVSMNSFNRYLKLLGLQTGGVQRTLNQAFILYNNDETEGYRYILKESIGMDDAFFQTVLAKIMILIDEYGYEDHIVIRSIPSRWFQSLPSLPSSAIWTPLFLQNLLIEYGTDKLNGIHTISASDTQYAFTLHTMIVTESSRVQTFSDAIIATLIDNDVSQRSFQKEELRKLLFKYGLISEHELTTILTNATDKRFVWDDAQRNVVIKV